LRAFWHFTNHGTPRARNHQAVEARTGLGRPSRSYIL
jgi:hypothetical protein